MENLFTNKIFLFSLIFVVGLLFLGFLLPDNSSNEFEFNESEIPDSYNISVPYYSGESFCYGYSSMMVLDYSGMTQAQVLEFKDYLNENGYNGPPDIFIGFEEYDYLDKAYIGYSSDFDSESAEFYSDVMDTDAVLFDSQENAFTYLKALVSSDIPVVALIQNENHYVVVTGYNSTHIFIHDPGVDNSGNPQGHRIIETNTFLSEWDLSQQDVEGNIGFPGDYGIIWIEE